MGTSPHYRTGARARPRGTPGAARAPVLLALLGALTSGGCLRDDPRELRWEVIGDALRVSFVGGGPAVRLESERGAVPLAAAAGPGRRSLVLRDLPRDSELAVRLVWEGGQSPPRGVRAAPAAIEGTPLLAGPGGISVRVRRRCELRFPGGAWRSVSPGEVRLESPARARGEPVRMEVREGGLVFPLSWGWGELARATFQALLSELGKLDEVQHLRGLVEAPDPALFAARADEAKEAFADLFSELPSLLVRDLPRVQGRALLRAWERFQRLAALERALGLPGRVPGSGEGQPGERPNGFPPWPGHARRVVSLAPVGQVAPLEPSPVYFLGVKLGHLGKLASTLRSFRPRNAVTELHGTWPRDAPEAGAEVAVGIWVENMVRETQLLLVTHAAKEEPLELRLWHPVPMAASRPRYTGWLVATLPAELAPRPGEGFHLELAPLFERVFRGNEVRQVEVVWRARGGGP